jgi:hypothetical protein
MIQAKMIHKARNNGTGLENFVCELYKDLGYTDVKRDHRFKKTYDQQSSRGQIDVTYTHLMIKRYTECKQYNGRNVHFDDYSKFETTLNTYNIPTYLGEMITSTYFDNKVRLRAKETKIRLIDRNELLRLSELRKSGPYLIIAAYRFMELMNTKGLGAAIKYLHVRSLSLDKQLKYYAK